MNTSAEHPIIIQGGMGAAVSNWRLANAVARLGHLGVVSGTAIDQILARRLQTGDPDGHMRRAIAHFPDQTFANRVLHRYFIDGGHQSGDPYVSPPLFRADPTPEHQRLNVLANFVEVWLAREGHNGRVGINLLDKIAFPNLTALYGAMLAGVDYVLMGAGIPWQLPGILDLLAAHHSASMRIPVEGDAPDGGVISTIDPVTLFEFPQEPLKRPAFLAIISSATVGQALLKRATGRIEGFVVERSTAGGHNAPPRGPLHLTPAGEPIYGPRDAVDLAKVKELGLPFWLAGGAGNHEQLTEALAAGAAGVQVGTAFAFCEESGVDPGLRRAVLARVATGEEHIFTDPAASPTGYPFKVVDLPGTLSDRELYEARTRVCDLGFLRRAYRKDDGSLGYRCPAEPVEDYVRKGGAAEDTEGRKCLCNGLLANIGLAQERRGKGLELPLLTAGDDLVNLGPLAARAGGEYRAADVIASILNGPTAPT